MESQGNMPNDIEKTEYKPEIEEHAVDTESVSSLSGTLATIGTLSAPSMRIDRKLSGGERSPYLT